LATTNKYFKVKNGLDVNSNATVDASGNANISGNLTANSGYVSGNTFRLDTTFVTGSSQIAELAWNPDDGTIEFAMKDGDVVHRIGQQMVIRVVNNTGSSISEGSVVYISGSSGQQPRIALANAATEGGSTKTFGFVTQNGGIANGTDGYVCTAGIMRGVDVGAYTAGTALWLANVAGTFTSTKPVAPDNGVFLGWVIKEGSAGSILVHVQNGYELEELHNVLIDGTPADNEILAWDSTSSLWKNQTAEEANIANTANTGTVTFLGNVTVTSGKQFNGNGAGLSSIPAGNLTGTAANIVYTTTTSLPNVTSVNSTTIPGSSTLLTTSSTLDASKLNTNTVVTLNATNVAATNVNATTVLVSGDANVAGKLSVTYKSGDEGGEIFLSNAATNTSITNGVTIDVYQNKLRFFEQGGSARGYYIDITAGGAGAGTALTGGGGGGSGTVTSIATTSPITGGTITSTGTIGINSSSTNTVNYVVQRDANGSFAANVVTATTFSGSGSGLTSLNASNISSGTIASGILGNSTVYIGTTAIALNRGTASQTLTGVSIDGNAGTVTNGVYTTTTSLPNVTSVNSTTIPNGATLLTTSNIGSTVQAYDADLASIAGLANTAGYLYNNGSGTFSYTTPTDTNTTYTLSAGGTTSPTITLTPSSGSANTITLATGGTGISFGQSAGTITLTINSSDANGASTIVARDANGSFAGNVVTATTATVSGTINANAITVAQQKNALVVSGYNSASGAFAQASRVIMTGTATGSSDPTTRPDGTALQAGDVWIDW
jgi:hypothetical protein